MSQLENVMADAIKDAHGSIGQATNFVLEQMPDLVQQAMLWYAFSSFFIMCFCICYCIFYIRFIKNFNTELLNGDQELVMALVIATGFAGFLFAIFGIFFNFDWLQIIIAPKLWLVEFAAQLTK
jgi:hypothetical protein